MRLQPVGSVKCTTDIVNSRLHSGSVRKLSIRRPILHGIATLLVDFYPQSDDCAELVIANRGKWFDEIYNSVAANIKQGNSPINSVVTPTDIPQNILVNITLEMTLMDDGAVLELSRGLP